MWWGSEAPTGLKSLAGCGNQIKLRIRNSNDIEETRGLKVLSKKITIMSALIEVVSDHGLGSVEFKQIYDLQLSMLSLSADVELGFPAFF